MPALKLFTFWLIIFAVIFATIYSYQDWKANLPLQFSAWAKHTGNPGRLTFEEWKQLPGGLKCQH